MIAFLNGKIILRGTDYIILDVNGVGYKVFVSRPESFKEGEQLCLYTYHHVREDDMSLYGFASIFENDFFLKLINVKGIGPKIAINIFAKTDYQKLISAIEEEDISFLKKLPGIGNKSASQIVLDLKGKLVKSDSDTLPPALMDAQLVLKNLGYKQGEINQVTNILKKDTDLTANAYVKQALQLLKKG